MEPLELPAGSVLQSTCAVAVCSLLHLPEVITCSKTVAPDPHSVPAPSVSAPSLLSLSSHPPVIFFLIFNPYPRPPCDATINLFKCCPRIQNK